MSDFKTVSKGVTSPKGFVAAGVACGLKKSGKRDLALIYSEVLGNAAGVFTSNRVKSTSILFTQKQIKEGCAQAILINSGNANTCVGRQGISDCGKAIKALAKELGVSSRSILMASTGIIGVPLPLPNIFRGIRDLRKKLSKNGGHEAAEAILTTDTRTKEVAIEVPLGFGERIVIGGMAKGAGMIAPNMGTMLAFITTDAVIQAKALKEALKDAVSKSFNCIVVDRDTSTNDTVLILANGLAKNREITYGSKSFLKFQTALDYVCIYLAKEIARDGEGSTKLIEVRVTRAKSYADAQLVAKAVAGSNLVKSAIFGEDPNWGRIMAAIGYAGAKINPEKINISIWREPLVKQGMAVAFDKNKLKKILAGSEILIRIDLGVGGQEATAWGCDLTYDYIKINAHYRT